jgi:DNA replication and repair protein RecF
VTRLVKLHLKDFRLVSHYGVEFAPGLNLIAGENATGKTSVIEAIRLLGSGRSFRTHLLDQVIAHQSEDQSAQIFGLVEHAQETIKIGFQRTLGESLVRVNGEWIRQLSQLAHWLPTQLMTPESLQILTSGPAHRRKFLDWGVFYFDAQFHSAWVEFNRLLNQRNALLKQRQDKRQIAIWDEMLAGAGERVDGARKIYLEAFEPLLNQLCHRFMPELIVRNRLTLHYKSGLPSKQGYAQALKEHLDKDWERGFTHYGPHRADLVIKIDQHFAQDFLSRGQQKILVSALLLAQMQLCSTRPLVLIDDLPSELDTKHQKRLLEHLIAEDLQVVLTQVDNQHLPLDPQRILPAPALAQEAPSFGIIARV